MVTCPRPGQARDDPDFQGMFIGRINTSGSTVQAGQSIITMHARMPRLTSWRPIGNVTQRACMAGLQAAQGWVSMRFLAHTQNWITHG